MASNINLSKQDRVMILAVHPDDESLAAGGLIQKAKSAGAAIRIVFITDGDNNPWPQRFLEGRWQIDEHDRFRWGMRRRSEALAAITRLGIGSNDVVFWGLPDQGVTQLLNQGDGRVLQLFIEEFKWNPSLLILPALQDRHPDHSATALLADLALQRLPELAINMTKLSYLIHGKQVSTAAKFGVRLSPKQLNNKREAILCHYTQTALSRRRFLGYAKAEEIFFSQDYGALYQPNQPLEYVGVEGSLLKIRMRLTALASRFSSHVLSLLAEQPDLHVRLKLAITPDSKTAQVINHKTGQIIGEAVICWNKRMAEVGISLNVLSGASNVYLKLDSSWGFYDLAGWHRLSLSALETRTAIQLVGIIPCYDVEDFCEGVITEAIKYTDHIIAIDDGSNDMTANILARLALRMPDRISVISFPFNQGKGMGLIAGFHEALKKFDFRALVTLDADGQHPPAEIPHLVKLVENGAEVAIGTRKLEQMPGRSRLGNTMASHVLRWFYPEAPIDTQSGLRAFNQLFVENIVKEVRGSRYETEFQILLLALSQKRKIVTVPIPTIYIDNNRSSKFRPVVDSLNILWALIRWRFNRIWASA